MKRGEDGIWRTAGGVAVSKAQQSELDAASPAPAPAPDYERAKLMYGPLSHDMLLQIIAEREAGTPFAPAPAPDYAALVERLNSHMGKQDVGVLLRDCRLAADAITALSARARPDVEALVRQRVIAVIDEEVEGWPRGCWSGRENAAYADGRLDAATRIYDRLRETLEVEPNNRSYSPDCTQ